MDQCLPGVQGAALPEHRWGELRGGMLREERLERSLGGQDKPHSFCLSWHGAASPPLHSDPWPSPSAPAHPGGSEPQLPGPSQPRAAAIVHLPSEQGKGSSKRCLSGRWAQVPPCPTRDSSPTSSPWSRSITPARQFMPRLIPGLSGTCVVLSREGRRGVRCGEDWPRQVCPQLRRNPCQGEWRDEDNGEALPGALKPSPPLWLLPEP